MSDKGRRDKVGYWNRLIQNGQDRIRNYQQIKDESSDMVIRALQDRKIQETQENIQEYESNKTQS